MNTNTSDSGGEMNLNKLAEEACYALRNLPGFLYCEATENELRFCFDNDLDAESYKSLRLLEEIARPMKVHDTVLIEYYDDNAIHPL
jgi:hypothetical protein